MKLLVDELKLKIEDLPNPQNREFQNKLHEAYNFMIDYLKNNDLYACLKTAPYTPPPTQKNS